MVVTWSVAIQVHQLSVTSHFTIVTLPASLATCHHWLSISESLCSFHAFTESLFTISNSAEEEETSEKHLQRAVPIYLYSTCTSICTISMLSSQVFLGPFSEPAKQYNMNMYHYNTTFHDHIPQNNSTG